MTEILLGLTLSIGSLFTAFILLCGLFQFTRICIGVFR
jgi:hypothetical protein